MAWVLIVLLSIFSGRSAFAAERTPATYQIEIFRETSVAKELILLKSSASQDLYWTTSNYFNPAKEAALGSFRRNSTGAFAKFEALFAKYRIDVSGSKSLPIKNSRADKKTWSLYVNGVAIDSNSAVSIDVLNLFIETVKSPDWQNGRALKVSKTSRGVAAIPYHLTRQTGRPRMLKSSACAKDQFDTLSCKTAWGIAYIKH